MHAIFEIKIFDYAETYVAGYILRLDTMMIVSTVQLVWTAVLIGLLARKWVTKLVRYVTNVDLQSLLEATAIAPKKTTRVSRLS